MEKFIDKFYNQLSDTKVLSLLLIVQGILMLASIPYHRPHGDEAWLGEQAYRLHETGYPHSFVIMGTAGEENYLALRHWLFIAMERSLIDAFGFSLPVLRILPIAFGLILCCLIFLYERESRATALCAITLFLMMPQSFFYFKIARPEIVVTCFGLASFVALSKSLSISKSIIYAIIAGLCAGLAMGTHLQGAIYVGAGIIVLLWKKHWMLLLYFFLGVVVAISPYLYEIIHHWDAFNMQLHNPFYVRRASISPLDLWVNLRDEHKRLFRNPQAIVTSMMALVSLIASWKNKSAKFVQMRIYTLALVVCLGLIANDKLDMYLVYLQPFFAIVIANYLVSITTSSLQRSTKVITSVVLSAFIIVCTLYQVRDIVAQKAIDVVSYNGEIGRWIPFNSICVAPIFFVFDEVTRLKIVSNYGVQLKAGMRLSISELAKYCDDVSAQYVVFTRDSEEGDIAKDVYAIPQDDASFTTVARGSDYIVLRRRILTKPETTQ